MTVDQIHPCPLCGGPAARWLLGGQEGYTKTACPRCGTFVVEPTLPALAWARLDAEDRVLVVMFLPAYIRRQNRRNRTPLLTLRNWWALAQRGRLVALSSPRPATIVAPFSRASLRSRFYKSANSED